MTGLSEWCEQAPHGRYYQPILLTVHDSNVDLNDSSFIPKYAARTAAVDAAATSFPDPESLASIPHEQTSIDTAVENSTYTENEQTLLVAPFQSSRIGPDQMVLNVGGPVWAMDWYPQHTTDVATHKTTKPVKAKEKVNKVKQPRGRPKKGTIAVPQFVEPEPEQIEIPVDDVSPMRSFTDNPAISASWRLLALSTHPPCEVVNGELVKNTPPEHQYSKTRNGRNLIQLWAIPVSSNDAPISPTPRLVYAIDHDSGVVWDLQWCPTFHKRPPTEQVANVLVSLAVCFGDGSLQLFDIPLISSHLLREDCQETVVDQLVPVFRGRFENVIPLSVRWCPHKWNWLLTGNSDGSSALWNIADSIVSQPSAEQDEIEPQRRFLDGDSMSKIERFEWGWGWVAVRAVAWSPTDPNIFVTIGNDAMFKLWDVREPRIPLRAHRLVCTWGMAVHWVEDTLIVISGDQGPVHTHDVLSGSHQKLHTHPQIDSPVWDLQLACRGILPGTMVTCCASGSVRFAPTKKLLRGPCTVVELCRLRGDPKSNVELPYKALSLCVEPSSTVCVEATSPRVFSERDASLHRVRLSTALAGVSPCFLAAAGHAGLVVIMEVSNVLDAGMDVFGVKGKKAGRPKKGTMKPAVAAPTPTPKKAVIRNNRGLAQFASPHAAKPMRQSLKKHTTLKSVRVVHMDTLDDVEEEADVCEEEEEEEAADSETDSEESIVLEDGDENSDEERVVSSPSDHEGEVDEAVVPSTDPETEKRRLEYQMDLSEDEAVRLALQISELDQPIEDSTDTSAVGLPRVATSPNKASCRFPESLQAAVTSKTTEGTPVAESVSTGNKSSKTPSTKTKGITAFDMKSPVQKRNRTVSASDKAAADGVVVKKRGRPPKSQSKLATSTGNSIGSVTSASTEIVDRTVVAGQATTESSKSSEVKTAPGKIVVEANQTPHRAPTKRGRLSKDTASNSISNQSNQVPTEMEPMKKSKLVETKRKRPSKPVQTAMKTKQTTLGQAWKGLTSKSAYITDKTRQNLRPHAPSSESNDSLSSPVKEIASCDALVEQPTQSAQSVENVETAQNVHLTKNQEQITSPTPSAALHEIPNLPHASRQLHFEVESVIQPTNELPPRSESPTAIVKEKELSKSTRMRKKMPLSDHSSPRLPKRKVSVSSPSPLSNKRCKASKQSHDLTEDQLIQLALQTSEIEY